MVWALCALFGILGIAYGVLVPLLHGPDEGAHVDRTATLVDQIGHDPSQRGEYSTDLLAAFEQVGVVAVDHRVSPLVPWVPLSAPNRDAARTEPSYDALAADRPTGKVNPALSGPPGYYWLLDSADEVAARAGLGGQATASWRATLAHWRLLSALLLLGLPWLAFWTARKVGGSRAAALLAAILALAVPQLSHSAGTVNNDALLLVAVWICSLACIQLARGDLRNRVALVAGASAGVGMLAKVFALGAPLWILFAILVGATDRSLRRRLVRAARPLTVAAAAAVAFGGWWPLGQLVVRGTPAPRGFNYPQPDEVHTSVATWLRELLERLPSTGFGRFGIEQFGLPGWLVVAATVAALTLVIVGAMAVLRHRGGGTLVVLLLPAATTLVMIVTAAWGGYARSGLPTGLHGRYLFVALPGLLALAGIGLETCWIRAGRPHASAWLPAMALVAAAGMQAAGLWTVTRSYWAGPLRGQVRGAMLSSGWSDSFLLAIGLLGLVTVAMVLTSLHQLRDDREATS